MLFGGSEAAFEFQKRGEVIIWAALCHRPTDADAAADQARARPARRPGVPEAGGQGHVVAL